VDLASLRDILRFRKERFFEGAVQLNWFYDQDKRAEVSRAFVFHGPEYFGVSSDDIPTAKGSLVDTCSFAQLLADRLYGSSDDNPMLLAVAGYGSGKSHLAVALASLFGVSPDDPLRAQILHNIGSSSKAAEESIRASLGKPSLVIALNGMQDFNLTYGILGAARASLKLHGIDDSPLLELSRASQIALTFVERNFTLRNDAFEEAAARTGVAYRGAELRSFLTQELEHDPRALEVINQVFTEVNGVPIRWDDGISVDQILSRLYQSFCGDRGYFERILILFDEFGRFIEYASEFPLRAGQAGLQQLYEALQNLAGGAQFVGFIQSDLRSYLARVQKDTNIIRFIGRYESSRRVYLSSNLETIFAHLIERSDPVRFDDLILQTRQRDMNRWRSTHEDLRRWIPGLEARSLWRDWSRFAKVVLEGTYPLHPITTYMLSAMSDWLQQRSALTFLCNEFERLSDATLDGTSDVPMIWPIRIVQSDFFAELLGAEEEGRQQSEYCISYRNVLAKHRDKCTDVMLDILAANVILRIGRFRTTSRADAIGALSTCIDHPVDVVTQAVADLEDELGVLAFDESTGCFDFVEDAVGARDFRSALSRYRRKLGDLDVSLILTRVELDLGISASIPTGFGTRNHIKTREWDCMQQLRHIASLDKKAIAGLKDEWISALSPDQPKGFVVWVYLGPQDDPSCLSRLQELVSAYGLADSPILFFLLDDSQGKLFDAMRDIVVLESMSVEDRDRYAGFIRGFRDRVTMSIENAFNDLASARLEITPDSIVKREQRLPAICEDRFGSVYPRIVPFPFDGFNNKNIAPAKKLLTQIARELLYRHIDSQSIQAYSKDMRNRIEVVLSSRSPGGWGVIDDDVTLQRPECQSVRTIFDELDGTFASEGRLVLRGLLDKYASPPYGLNEFAIGLLAACYIAFWSDSAKLSVQDKMVRTTDWASRVYTDKGIDFDLLRDTSMNKVEGHEYTARYERVCSSIEKASDVGEVLACSAELRSLQSEEDPPEALKYRVQACEGLIKRATEFQKRATNLLEEQHEYLRSGIKSNNLRSLLILISKCEKHRQLLNEDGQIRCRPEDDEEFMTLAQRARRHLEARFDDWLDDVRCDSVSEVGRFEDQIKRVEELLCSAGYDGLARKLKDRRHRIVDDMEHIRLLQTIRQRTEAYLDECRPSPASMYGQLVEWKQRGKELLEQLCNDNRLSSRERTTYSRAVEEKCNLVEQELNAIQDRIAHVYDSAMELATLDDCSGVLSEARLLLSRNLHQVDKDELTNVADVLSQFIKSVSQLDSIRLDRARVSKAISAHRQDWSNNPADLDLTHVLDSIWNDIQRDLDQVDRKWQSEFLPSDPTDVEGWTSEECVEWLSNTDAVPSFASEATRFRIQALRTSVHKRLSSLKVEAVVEMFLRLDEIQRRECLRELTALLADSA
jgi:hypothetical protein